MRNKLIDDILANVKLKVDEETTNWDSWLRLEINHHIREFMIRETFRKTCADLKIVGCKICLPDDFYELGVLVAECYAYPNWLQYQQSLNPTNNPNFVPAAPPNVPCVPYIYYNSDRRGYWGLGDGWGGGCNTGTYQLNGDSIDIMGNFNAVRAAKLYYKAYNVDSNGSFKGQPKGLENAAACKIAAKYMRKFRKKKGYTQDDINAMAMDGVALFEQVKGSSIIRQFYDEAPQLKDVSNAILIDYNNCLNGYGFGEY